MNSSDSEDDSDNNNFAGPWTLNPANDAINKPNSTNKFKHQKSFGWEIIEGLLDDKSIINCPRSFKGILYRRRKWPMKGWSKLHIVLESGIMAYSKSNHQMEKRNFHGRIDLGLAIVSFKAKRHRIDIDDERILYHLKAKDYISFSNWIENIKMHRLYRQYELINNRESSAHALYNRSIMSDTPMSQNPEDYIINTLSITDRDVANKSSPADDDTSASSSLDVGSANENQMNTSSKLPDKRLAYRRARKELMRTITLVGEDDIQAGNSSSFVIINEDFKLITQKLANLSDELAHISNNLKLNGGLNSSASNPSLNKQSGAVTPTRPAEMSPGGTNKHNSKFMSTLSSPDFNNMKLISFTNIANDVLLIMKNVNAKLIQERDKLTDSANTLKRDSSNSWPRKMIVQIKELSQQNMELKSRLNRIRLESSLPFQQNSFINNSNAINKLRSDSVGMSLSATDDFISDMDNNQKTKNISIVTSECFYDAAEFLDSDSASSISDNEEIDEVSEPEDESPIIEEAESQKCKTTLYQEMTGRRDKMPAPQPDISQFSLMNLLCKNIGRDLSKIRLPVLLNEPLSVLQMLCEELEYSDLLDTAAKTNDPIERMNHLVAFAISGYASTLHRTGTKPFNPLIGETYEYQRKDKGWKFVAEQVSHHPPISVCHCESDNWVWWQEFRLKNKFWGKSIEAIPNGSIGVVFKKFNEQVKWNKVTTCVYNIFGQNRYVEHYGDMNFISRNITDNSPGPASAKITFHKSSWSHQKYEVSGTVQLDGGSSVSSSNSQLVPSIGQLPVKGGSNMKIFGKWTEAIYAGHQGRCLWRPGAMPEDFEQYYGFTQFAIDLNNPPSAAVNVLPQTDSRFRPDQRFLEQGMLNEAEEEKMRIEEKQRERLAKIGGDANWKSIWFGYTGKSSELGELYRYNNKYWAARDQKWVDYNLPEIW